MAWTILTIDMEVHVWPAHWITLTQSYFLLGSSNSCHRCNVLHFNEQNLQLFLLTHLFFSRIIQVSLTFFYRLYLNCWKYAMLYLIWMSWDVMVVLRYVQEPCWLHTQAKSQVYYKDLVKTVVNLYEWTGHEGETEFQSAWQMWLYWSEGQCRPRYWLECISLLQLTYQYRAGRVNWPVSWKCKVLGLWKRQTWFVTNVEMERKEMSMDACLKLTIFMDGSQYSHHINIIITYHNQYNQVCDNRAYIKLGCTPVLGICNFAISAVNEFRYVISFGKSFWLYESQEC